MTHSTIWLTSQSRLLHWPQLLRSQPQLTIRDFSNSLKKGSTIYKYKLIARRHRIELRRPFTIKPLVKISRMWSARKQIIKTSETSSNPLIWKQTKMSSNSYREPLIIRLKSLSYKLYRRSKPIILRQITELNNGNKKNLNTIENVRNWENHPTYH